MIPFKVKTSGGSVGITWDSLIWFFIATAAATVVGELVYQKWVSPYLASLPNLPGSTPTVAQLPPSTGDGTVVSTQTPQFGMVRNAKA